MTALARLAVDRPVLRWHGGKWRIAPWIISYFGPHRAYVEPFSGAWSVGLRKPPAHAELWNDLDAELVNLFSILRDERRAPTLIRAIAFTPFARDEFRLAYEVCEEPIERARRLIIRSWMGQGAVGNHTAAGASGFRDNLVRSEQSPRSPIPAHDWAGYPKVLQRVVDRVARVVIQNRPALEIMAKHDRADALFYLDPPYLADTRSKAGRRPGTGFLAYQHELSDDDHDELLAFIVGLKSMVVLSGYPSARYDEALPGWTKIEKRALKDGAATSTECLWLNEAATRVLPQGRLL
jgi:DNA adenine methylase